MSRILTDINGGIELPREPGEMLDGIVLHITDQVQQGADLYTLLEQVHDMTCFWLSNLETPEEKANRMRKMN